MRPPSGLRRQLSFANAISVIALFIALGGSTYAAVKLKANSVGSRQVKDDSLNGSDVNESALGQVPSAADAGLLDGIDSSELARRGLSWQAVAAAHQSSNPPGRFRCHHSDGVECDQFFGDLDGAGGHAGTAYGKDDFGIVHLQGSIRFQSAIAGPVNPGPVFQLPAGLRPPDRRVFAVLENGSAVARLNIESDGSVSLAQDYADGDWFSLDGIDFPAVP